MRDLSGHFADERNPFGSVTCDKCGVKPRTFHSYQWHYYCAECCPDCVAAKQEVVE